MLTKPDLQSIRLIIKEEVISETGPIRKGLKRIEKKFDELFDFLDRKYIEVKKDIRNIQGHIKLPLSEY